MSVVSIRVVYCVSSLAGLWYQGRYRWHRVTYWRHIDEKYVSSHNDLRNLINYKWISFALYNGLQLTDESLSLMRMKSMSLILFICAALLYNQEGGYVSRDKLVVHSLGPSGAYISVGKLTIIGSDNALSPGWHQAIIRGSAWNIVNLILRNKIQWNIYRYSYFLI